MNITLTPKKDGYYGLKVDSAISPLTEQTLQYILNDKYYDNSGIYENNNRYIVTIQNGTKFSINDKSDFLEKLSKAYSDVSISDDVSSFEIQ